MRAEIALPPDDEIAGTFMPNRKKFVASSQVTRFLTRLLLHNCQHWRIFLAEME
jgi:hypothetical protein